MASIRCECKNTNYVLSLHEGLTFLLCFRQQGICINMYFQQEMVPYFIKVLDFKITGYFIYIRNIRLNKSLFFWKKVAIDQLLSGKILHLTSFLQTLVQIQSWRIDLTCSLKKKNLYFFPWWLKNPILGVRVFVTLRFKLFRLMWLKSGQWNIISPDPDYFTCSIT